MHNNENDVPFHARHEEELLTLDEVAEIPDRCRAVATSGPCSPGSSGFFKIGRRLFTTVGELRRFIREQRLSSRPVIVGSKAG